MTSNCSRELRKISKREETGNPVNTLLLREITNYSKQSQKPLWWASNPAGGDRSWDV
jgi:hypothetical protein